VYFDFGCLWDRDKKLHPVSLCVFRAPLQVELLFDRYPQRNLLPLVPRHFGRRGVAKSTVRGRQVRCLRLRSSGKWRQLHFDSCLDTSPILFRRKVGHTTSILPKWFSFPFRTYWYQSVIFKIGGNFYISQPLNGAKLVVRTSRTPDGLLTRTNYRREGKSDSIPLNLPHLHSYDLTLHFASAAMLVRSS
jgi:hypothetical protein